MQKAQRQAACMMQTWKARPIPRDAAVAAPIIVAARVGGRASDPASLTTACSHALRDAPGPPRRAAPARLRAGYGERRLALPSRRFPVIDRALATSYESVQRGSAGAHAVGRA